jgi:hypothetical protein
MSCVDMSGGFRKIRTVTAADSADPVLAEFLPPSSEYDRMVCLIDVGTSCTLQPCYGHSVKDGDLTDVWRAPQESITLGSAGKYQVEFSAYPGMYCGVYVTANSGTTKISAQYGRSQR